MIFIKSRNIKNRKKFVHKTSSYTTLFLVLLIINAPSVFADEGIVADAISVETNHTDGISIYPPNFFYQYLPQNSLEMIELLPGFNFDQGSNARGFGGTAGNVLIDNARPTSKSGGLRGALIRIPASQVERIEILRGGINAGEAAGQSIVANVVRKKAGTSGTSAFKLRRAPRGDVQPNLEATITTTLGDWNTAFDIDSGSSKGFRTATIENLDGEDQLSSGTYELFDDRSLWLFANGEGSREIANGTLTLNAHFGRSKWKGDTDRNIFIGRFPDDSVPEQLWELNEKNSSDTGELGIDWSQTSNNWKWHILGIGSFNEFHYENKFHNEELVNDVINNSNFVQDSKKTEFITRSTYGKISGSKFKPEYGIEFAKNKLSSGLEFIQNGEEILLSGDDVVVEELRSEAFATFVYEKSPKLSLEGGITGEVSRIKVSGNNAQQQTYKFVKPRLSATYKYNKNSQLTIEAERRVGQLDFNDFAASSQASDNRTTSGNPALAPDTTDEVAATYDWSFSNRGSLKVKIFHQWRSDILEQIILTTGGQGIGNAGNARFWGIKTDINLPLDNVLPDGLLELSHVYQGSRFNDPIIGGKRTVNGYTPNWLTFKLRQDIVKHKLAWGVEYWGDFTDTNFFVDEIQKFSGNRRLRVFVETSRYFGVKTQLDITNINTGKFTRSRFLFVSDRGGEFEGSEIARRRRKPEVKLSFWKTF